MLLYIYDNLRKLLSEQLIEKTHIYKKELDFEYESELNTNIYRIKSVFDYFSVCYSHKFKALYLEIQNQIITDNIINNNNKLSSSRITLNKFIISELSNVRS